MNLDLDKYIVKVLSHEEINIIKKFTLTIHCPCQDNMEMYCFSPENYLYMKCKSIVLCYPQSIEKNIDSICDGNKAIIFLTTVSEYDYFNPQLWFWDYYFSPNIKDILLNNFHITNFTVNSDICEHREKQNNVSKKIITHFQNIFILAKEIIDIEDVVKYMFTFVFMNLSNEKN
jgi:hypothetical protein